jgi:predicted transcriptional regulator
MPRKKTEGLTPLELEIMKVLWQGGPATVLAIHEQVSAARPLAYNTVQTMLTILHEKGKVRRTMKDRAYVYQARVTEDGAAHQAVQDLIQRVFGGRADALVLSMVKNRQIGAEELAELQRKVEEAEEGGDEPRS